MYNQYEKDAAVWDSNRHNYCLDFTVLIEAINIRRIAPQSFCRGLYCSLGI